jgi:hypothetical protein
MLLPVTGDLLRQWAQALAKIKLRIRGKLEHRGIFGPVQLHFFWTVIVTAGTGD